MVGRSARLSVKKVQTLTTERAPTYPSSYTDPENDPVQPSFRDEIYICYFKPAVKTLRKAS